MKKCINCIHRSETIPTCHKSYCQDESIPFFESKGLDTFCEGWALLCSDYKEDKEKPKPLKLDKEAVLKLAEERPEFIPNLQILFPDLFPKKAKLSDLYNYDPSLKIVQYPVFTILEDYNEDYRFNINYYINYNKKQPELCINLHPTNSFSKYSAGSKYPTIKMHPEHARQMAEEILKTLESEEKKH